MSEATEDLIEVRALDGTRIVRTGIGAYLCYSSSRPDVSYPVDLCENNGLGSCQCEDFLYRGYPRFKKVGKPYDIYRCRHIRKVRNFVLDAIISVYAQKR